MADQLQISQLICQVEYVPSFVITGGGGAVGGGSAAIAFYTGSISLGGLFSIQVCTVDADIWYPGVGGALPLPLPLIAGAIWQSGIGTGFRLPRIVSSGSITVTTSLSGGITIPHLTMAGDITTGYLISASITLPKFRSDGNIPTGLPLSADISLKAVLVAGEVFQGFLFNLAATLSGFTVEGGISLGNGYSVLVVNIENYARTEYTEFPFNSFIVRDGKAYGACADGIFLLEGPDDDGTYIDAAITTGLADLGTSLKKNVPDVYLGYDTDGQIGIQSITDDMTEGSEQVKEKAVNEIGKARVKMPMGRMSRYWGYRVRNIAGASLEIDSIEPRQSVGVRRV